MGVPLLVLFISSEVKESFWADVDVAAAAVVGNVGLALGVCPSRGDVVVSAGGEGGAAVIAFAVVLFVVIGGTVAGPGAFVVVEVEVGFGSFSCVKTWADARSRTAKTLTDFMAILQL